jgi:hypothetical protein
MLVWAFNDNVERLHTSLGVRWTCGSVFILSWALDGNEGVFLYFWRLWKKMLDRFLYLCERWMGL